MHALRHTGVVSLTELEIKLGRGDRVDEPGDQFTRIGRDIAVMERNNVAVSLGDHITKGEPGLLPFAVWTGV